MQTIICLGPKACDIGEGFEKNSNYITKLIDVDIEGENCFSLLKQNSAEEYEKNCPDMTHFFSDITTDILFITSGDCEVLSSSLKILNQIKNNNLSILYLKPINNFCVNLEDRLVFNVFQQYARSGLFNKLFIVDDNEIENLLGDIPITEWHNKYIELIFNTYDAINVLSSKEPIINNKIATSNVARIGTFGFYDLQNDVERLFFNIKNIDNKCYNFIINENSLKNDNKLFKLIKENMKNKVVDNTKISYTIHSTNNEKNYCYVTANTKIIQEY